MQEGYTIPTEIDTRIPEAFYFAFGGELVSVFGPKVFEEVDPEEGGKEDEKIYGIDMLASSIGWGEAFHEVCRQLNLMWLWEYYTDLGWENADLFDGIIAERIVQRMRGKSCSSNAYYRMLLEKTREEKKREREKMQYLVRYFVEDSFVKERVFEELEEALEECLEMDFGEDFDGSECSLYAEVREAEGERIWFWINSDGETGSDYDGEDAEVDAMISKALKHNL